MNLKLTVVAILLGSIFGLATRRLLYKKNKKALGRANEIALLVQQKKFKAAIKLGESVPSKELTWLEKMNLVGAYYPYGRIDKARKLFVTIKPPSSFTIQMTPQTKKIFEDWKDKLS